MMMMMMMMMVMGMVKAEMQKSYIVAHQTKQWMLLQVIISLFVT